MVVVGSKSMNEVIAKLIGDQHTLSTLLFPAMFLRKGGVLEGGTEELRMFYSNLQFLGLTTSKNGAISYPFPLKT